MNYINTLICIQIIISSLACAEEKSNTEVSTVTVEPKVKIDPVIHDSDDPAIWIHPFESVKSLIIGTDKDKDGALYAFNLNGKVVKVVKDIARPNNVDVAYGFPFKEELIDIAVVTERLEQRIRIFKLPELETIDGGDLIVFDGDTDRAPMGIAVYKRPGDHSFYVFVSGKSGPETGYIGQYLLKEDENNQIRINPVRKFGRYS